MSTIGEQRKETEWFSFHTRYYDAPGIHIANPIPSIKNPAMWGDGFGFCSPLYVHPDGTELIDAVTFNGEKIQATLVQNRGS